MKMDIAALSRAHIENQERKTMPDASNTLEPRAYGALDCVGMRGIEIPVLVRNSDQRVQTCNARANFFVNLNDAKAKGIHMSRLYLAGQKILAEQDVSFKTLKLILKSFVDTHQDLSTNSFIKLSFDYALQQKALLSDNAGWRYYPVIFEGRMSEGKFVLDLSLTITYSSTCPCSAALTRQVIQKQFETRFDGQDVVSAADIYEWLGKDEALAGTPHSQRSHAIIKMRFINDEDVPYLEDLINLIEAAIKTPVQTAVKRQDEQEFARLNGENLMFCEDAARLIKVELDAMENLADYRIEVEHLESLHAHDAVAITTKGVENGFIV